MWISHVGAQHANHYTVGPTVLSVTHNRGLIISVYIFNIYIHNSAGKKQESMEFMVELNFMIFEHLWHLWDPLSQFPLLGGSIKRSLP